MSKLSSVLSNCAGHLQCGQILRRFGVPAIVLSTLLVAYSSASAQEEYEKLLTKIPRTANAIMAINVDGLHDSPIGKAKHWKDKHEDNYVNRPFILPPEANYAVVGAMFDPVTKDSIWELGVMSLESEVPVRGIARAEGGYVDNVNGTDVAWVPSNAYFVQIAAKTLGVMYPAHRQALARWVDFAKKDSEGELSPYLKASATLIEDNAAQVVLAIDLKDMVRPHELKRKLADSPALKGKKIDLEALGKAITSLQGATMTVSLRDKAYGRLQVDFGGDVHVVTPVAKQLILEALDDMGAHIEEMKDWSLETSGGSVSLNGELSESGLRRLGSILELPDAQAGSDKDATPPAGPSAQASKAYYNSIQTMVDDLRKTLRDERDNHAVWMEKYARKIDRLPILNVDQDLLAFGAQTAERLRQAAVAKRSGLVRAGVRKSEVYGNYYDYGDGYGSYVSTENQRSSIQLAENAQSTKVRIDVWKSIEDDMAQVRKNMTQRYNVEF